MISRELGGYAVQPASTPHLSTYLAGCWGIRDEEALVPLSIAASWSMNMRRDKGGVV